MGIIAKPIPRLVEVTSVPVIYVDDNGKVVVEGNNVRITYVEFRTFGTERVRMPVVEIVRPLASLQPERMLAMLKEAMGGSAAVCNTAH